MPNMRTIVRKDSIVALRSEKYGNTEVPIYRSTLIHQYVHLDIDHDVEFATTKESAQRYLKAVAEAAAIVHLVASRPEYGGLLLEPQGSTIHAAIPLRGEYRGTAILFAVAVHELLEVRMGVAHSCVKGWRITSDVGRTLVVAGRGVHGDQSLVSIGNAANRPAKYLYKQLSLPEDKQSLKRYSLGIRSEGWGILDLRAIASRGSDVLTKEAALSSIKYDVQLIRAGKSQTMLVTADAHPIAPPGSSGSPTADRPAQHHGWVMRADLDGFTARVETCFDEDFKLDEVARWFARVMECAASFVEANEESMIQLPWAGDNFTVAVIFADKEDYDAARPSRLVEHLLDFDSALLDVLGSHKWAYGVCGGDVHGNAVGNVFIGSIGIGTIRFLIGSGAGFSRSLQSFADIKPRGGCSEIMQEDHRLLVGEYKDCFQPAQKVDGTISTLFKEAQVSDLAEVQDDMATTGRSVNVTIAPGISAPLAVKPHATRTS